MYNDIADIEAYHRLGLDYQDLCDPDWFHDDKELALGFWGECFNMYRAASPHEGYSILKAWRKKCCDKISEAFLKETFRHVKLQDNTEEPAFTPFFIYTSNVDAHFHREFDEKEIYEIHGNVEVFFLKNFTYLEN